MWINLIVLDVVFFEAAFLEVDFLVEADFLIVVFLLSFLDSDFLAVFFVVFLTTFLVVFLADFLVDLAVEVEVTTFLPLDLRV
ncbi:hypothetical protein IMAU50079_01143 [Lactobacillus helveticus]|nr:hypothetical protein [Lactobacillus helveticus]